MLRVLGPLEVEGPDGPVPVGGPVPRRILCALLVRPGAVVPVDSLLDAAWGDDPPPSAERTLISHITRLREALARVGGTAPPRLEHRGGGYRLVVAPEAVDAVRFEQTLLDVKNLIPGRGRGGAARGSGGLAPACPVRRSAGHGVPGS